MPAPPIGGAGIDAGGRRKSSGHRIGSKDATEKGELMLQLTHAAAAELVGTREAQGLPETAGLRVFGEPTSGGEVALRVTFAEVAAEDDQVTEVDGMRLFVAPEVAEPLSSAALDISETGDGGKSLVITQQPETGT